MLSRFAGIYVWLITGMPFTDPTGGYKCFRRRALQAINLDKIRSNGYSFQIEMTHKIWRQGSKSSRCPSFSPTACKDNPKCPAASSARRSGWSGGCGCKTACAARRVKKSATNVQKSLKLKLMRQVACLNITHHETKILLVSRSFGHFPFLPTPQGRRPAPLFTGQGPGRQNQTRRLAGKKSCCCIFIPRISPAAAQRKRAVSVTAWGNSRQTTSRYRRRL